MIADALELPLDDIRYLPEVAVATRDLDLGFMEIPKGHVAGLKNRSVGVADGVEVIEFGTIWKMTEDVEPNWEIRHGWHIVVDGMPTVKAHVAGWPPEGESNSEVLISIAMVMTALPSSTPSRTWCGRAPWGRHLQGPSSRNGRSARPPGRPTLMGGTAVRSGPTQHSHEQGGRSMSTTRTIVIGGCASGLGAATRRQAEKDGMKVIGIDLRDAEIIADLGTAQGREEAVARAVELCGGSLDGLVGYAGVGPITDPPALLARVNFFGQMALLDGLRESLKSGDQPAAVAVGSVAATVAPYDEEGVAAMLDGDEDRGPRSSVRPPDSGTRRRRWRWPGPPVGGRSNGSKMGSASTSSHRATR